MKRESIFKKWWFYPLVGLGIILIAVIYKSGQSDDPAQTQNTTQSYTQNTSAQTDSPSHQVTDAPSAENITLGPETLLILMRDSFKDTGSVEYLEADKTFTITPTDETFINDMLAVSTGDAAALESWDSMVESICGMSKNMPGYTVSILNPANTENTILMVYEGIVIYDFTKE